MVEDPSDWKGQLEPYYQRAADFMGTVGITHDAARAANGFWKKYQHRGTAATALAKLEWEGAVVPFGAKAEPKAKAKGKAKAKAATAAAAAAAPAQAADPKTMITSAFLAGQIDIDAFTRAIAALNGGAAKTVEAPAQPEALDLTGTDDDDLPF